MLVENIEDVGRLADTAGPELMRSPLAFVTQTTLSVDDTQGIVDALKLRKNSRPSSGPTRKISATPPPTGRRP